MKLLSPKIHWVKRTRFGPWKYVLTGHVVYFIDFDAGVGNVFAKNGRKIASWEGRILTIYAGYAWDGMTGYPDRDRNKKVSLAHDLGYQLSCSYGNPFTKAEVDSWLYDLTDCRLEKRITLLGVQIFGKLFWGFGESDCDIQILKKRP